MKSFFSLVPRYRLDDEQPWLVGIDPSRHYWIAINGEKSLTTAIPGLLVESREEFKATVLKTRALQAGENVTLQRAAIASTIHCIGSNCYAIEASVNGAPVWHLFDRESLESLLMTAHPDWQCAPQDVELGRQLLLRSLGQSLAAA